jgi:hypothetical protein
MAVERGFVDQSAALWPQSKEVMQRYWPAFTKVLENERLFILVYGPWQYAVLPKREFASPESIEELRGYLGEQISTYKMV